MKKTLLIGMMVLMLGACTSTKAKPEQKKDTTMQSRDTGNWVDQAGDVDSQYWWIEGDSDDSDDSDD